jgi:hypothetical protein
VRRDLPWAQRAVQAAHAVANLVFTYRDELEPDQWGETGPHFVVYGVSGEPELLDVARTLDGHAVVFHEPDLGNRATAVAYFGPADAAFDSYDLL